MVVWQKGTKESNMNMKRYKLSVFLVVMTLIIPAVSSAQTDDPTTVEDLLQIRIDPTGNPRIQTNLAVPNSLNLGSGDPQLVGPRINTTLRRDLGLAGYFNLLLPDSYFFDQHADGMTEATVDFQNWFNVGAEGLVKTAFRLAGNQVRLDFRLFNVTTDSEIQLDFEPVTVGVSDVEDQVHEFANQILQYYSGYPGPFGSTIALVGRGQDGSREIYGMTVGGDGIWAVTQNRSINIQPRWAGNQIVFTTYINGNPDLAITTPDDELTILSEREGLNMGGDLSPAGDVMAVSLSHQDDNSEIYLISPEDGSMVSRLTENRAEDISPVWSSGGGRLAFVSDRSGGPQIYIMEPDGTDQHRVTFAGQYNTTPDWSPDGTLIAFTGRDSRNRFDIFTVDVATSYVERLTQDQGDNEEPTWSPDGQYIIFTSTRGGGEPRLYMMTRDGTFQTLLTTDGSGYSAPCWNR